MYPSLVDDNFWFGQWKERVKTSTICSVWWVHVWDVAKENCVYVCRMSMWMSGRMEDFWMLTLTESPPWRLYHVCKYTCCFIPWGFQKYRGIDPHSHLSTLHKHKAKHSVQTEWESTGRLSIYAAVCDPYLFLWVLQAASHRHVTHRHTKGPWTLTLCTTTAVRGKNLLPHTALCSSMCTFLTSHGIFSWWHVTLYCICTQVCSSTWVHLLWLKTLNSIIS